MGDTFVDPELLELLSLKKRPVQEKDPTFDEYVQSAIYHGTLNLNKPYYLVQYNGMDCYVYFFHPDRSKIDESIVHTYLAIRDPNKGDLIRARAYFPEVIDQETMLWHIADIMTRIAS